MASKPSHRGPHPKDLHLFQDNQLPRLRAAVHDLSWLLDRGYATRSALELVGNRHELTSRQRMAVSRSVCSVDEVSLRQNHLIAPEQLHGEELWIDGYNVLTVLESALSGGIVLLGRDGCCRDIAGIHRRYRKVSETVPVLRLIGETATRWRVHRCHWWLDKPVSSSGRLKQLIVDTAHATGWDMAVDLSFSPDHVLSHTDHTIATSDGIILNRCRRWVNLARLIIAERIPQARLLDLSGND